MWWMGAINHFYWRAEQPMQHTAIKKGEGILRVHLFPHKVTFHISLGFSNSSNWLAYCVGLERWAGLWQRAISWPQQSPSSLAKVHLKPSLCSRAFLSVICISNQTEFYMFSSWTVLRLTGWRLWELVCSHPWPTSQVASSLSEISCPLVQRN